MSIISALNISTTGLHNTEKGLEVVSRNIANAGEEGYHRQRLVSIDEHGVVSSSVNSKIVKRTLDRVMQRQLTSSTSDASLSSTQLDYYNRLDVSFGAPGSEMALDTLMNDVTSSLENLMTSPESQTARLDVLSRFDQFSDQLNTLSQEVQALRQDAEYHIQQSVDELNSLLGSLHEVNVSLAASGTNPSVSILDERDRLVHSISEIVDVKVLEGRQNTIQLSTKTGLSLLSNKGAEFNFQARDHMTPMAEYSRDPSERSVGAVLVRSGNGTYQDVTHDGSIQSGKLRGLIDLRDKVLMETQAQLDEIAASMTQMLSSYSVEGDAITGGGADGFSIDVSDLEPGNSVSLSVTDSGVDMNYQFIHVDDPAALPFAEVQNGLSVIGVDFSDPTQAALDIQAALGGNFTVSAAGTTVSIVDDGAAGLSDVSALSATLVAQGVNDGIAALPVFIDARTGEPYTGTLGNPGQKQGFSGFMVLNPELLRDNSNLVIYQDPANHIGDTTRPEFMIEALTEQTMAFSASAGLGTHQLPLSTNVKSLVRQVINVQAYGVEEAGRFDANRQVALTAIETRYNDKSGVSIDEEMASLLTLQNTYAANARVMQVAKEMFERLIQL